MPIGLPTGFPHCFQIQYSFILNTHQSEHLEKCPSRRESEKDGGNEIKARETKMSGS